MVILKEIRQQITKFDVRVLEGLDNLVTHGPTALVLDLGDIVITGSQFIV